MKNNSFLDKVFSKIPNGRYSLPIFCTIAFFESSFFPIPPDVFMIPMVIAAPKRAWSIALLGTIFSVLGGILAYVIGASFYESIGLWIIQTYNLLNSFNQMQETFLNYGFWIISCKGILPFIPYKIIAITSGITGFPIKNFIIASFIGRGSRFIFLSAALYLFGPKIKEILYKHSKSLACISICAVSGVFILLKVFL